MMATCFSKDKRYSKQDDKRETQEHKICKGHKNEVVQWQCKDCGELLCTLCFEEAPNLLYHFDLDPYPKQRETCQWFELQSAFVPGESIQHCQKHFTSRIVWACLDCFTAVCVKCIQEESKYMKIYYPHDAFCESHTRLSERGDVIQCLKQFNKAHANRFTSLQMDFSRLSINKNNLEKKLWDDFVRTERLIDRLTHEGIWFYDITKALHMVHENEMYIRDFEALVEEQKGRKLPRKTRKSKDALLLIITGALLLIDYFLTGFMCEMLFVVIVAIFLHSLYSMIKYQSEPQLHFSEEFRSKTRMLFVNRPGPIKVVLKRK